MAPRVCLAVLVLLLVCVGLASASEGSSRRVECEKKCKAENTTCLHDSTGSSQAQLACKQRYADCLRLCTPDENLPKACRRSGGLWHTGTCQCPRFTRLNVGGVCTVDVNQRWQFEVPVEHLGGLINVFVVLDASSGNWESGLKSCDTRVVEVRPTTMTQEEREYWDHGIVFRQVESSGDEAIVFRARDREGHNSDWFRIAFKRSEFYFQPSGHYTFRNTEDFWTNQVGSPFVEKQSGSLCEPQ